MSPEVCSICLATLCQCSFRRRTFDVTQYMTEDAAKRRTRQVLDDLEQRIRQKFLCFECGCAVCTTLPTEAEVIVGMIDQMREGLQ